MELQDFLTLDTLFLLPTMIAICWGAVSLMKGLIDKALGHVQTSRVVFIIALVLTLLKTLYENQNTSFATLSLFQIILNVMIIVTLWLANALVVWLAAMKVQEKFVEN